MRKIDIFPNIEFRNLFFNLLSPKVNLNIYLYVTHYLWVFFIHEYLSHL